MNEINSAVERAQQHYHGTESSFLMGVLTSFELDYGLNDETAKHAFSAYLTKMYDRWSQICYGKSTYR